MPPESRAIQKTGTLLGCEKKSLRTTVTLLFNHHNLRQVMDYHLEFLPSALEQLRGLPKDARCLIGAKLDRAQHDLTGDITKLRGFKNKYRLRAGNYRAL